MISLTLALASISSVNSIIGTFASGCITLGFSSDCGRKCLLNESASTTA